VSMQAESAKAQAAALELTLRLDETVTARSAMEKTVDDAQRSILELKRDLELERTRAEV
jgi:hypothetical protein